MSQELPEGWSWDGHVYRHDDCPTPMPDGFGFDAAEVREYPFFPDIAVCRGCNASIELEDTDPGEPTP